MGRPYGNNLETVRSNGRLFSGVQQTSNKWQVAEPPDVYKQATKHLRKRLAERAEITNMQFRLARLHMQIAEAKKAAA